MVQSNFQCLGKFRSRADRTAALRRITPQEEKFADLGHLLHALINEGKDVAKALGITLHDDPWEMNKIGARTDHPPSMLYDIRHHLRTEIDFLGGAIAREAANVNHPAPLHTALYRLIRGKEHPGLQPKAK